MAIFPASLPPVSREGYSRTVSTPKSRFLMDDGHYFDQRKFVGHGFTFMLEWRFTWSQLSYFEAWLEYEVMRAQGWFTILIAGQSVRCVPAQEPTIEQANNVWVVKLQVEHVAAGPNMGVKGAIPQWPTTLPTLDQSGYTYAKSGSWTRPEIEEGLKDYRNRFRNKLTTFGGSLLLDSAQRIIFWNFYRDQSAYGISWFLFPFENGLGRTYARCKFGSEHPSESAMGSMYTVTLSLETGAAPMMTRTQFYNA